MGKSIGGKAFSVRFFLNKRVKPRKDAEGKTRYALYAQVNYDLKNTKLPIYDRRETTSFTGFNTPTPIYLRERFFNSALEILLGTKVKGPKVETFGELTAANIHYSSSKLSIIAHQIESVIRYENNNGGFKLKEFNLRFKKYQSSLGSLFQSSIQAKYNSYYSEDREIYFTTPELPAEDDDNPSSDLNLEQHDHSEEFVDEDQYYFDGEDSAIMELYPSIKFMTVEEFVDFFFLSLDSDYHLSVPEDIRLDIELFFLLAGSGVGRSPLIEWLFNTNNLDKFEEFLSNGDLYNKDKPLKVDLKNYYSRYISLTAPSMDKEYYLEKIKSVVNQEVRRIMKNL